MARLALFQFLLTSSEGRVDEAREEAERKHGPLKQMQFLVTDNGSSFVARRFRQHLPTPHGRAGGRRRERRR